MKAKIHGILDYVVVGFLLLSPTLFQLTGPVSLFTYALAFVHLALTFLTDFPMGVIKIISFKLHGWIELVVSIVLISFSFILNLEGVDFYYYLSFGGAVLITWAITKYE